MSKNNSCICAYYPCSEICPCADPVMSGPCLYCCGYGSEKQRQRQAKRLLKLIGKRQAALKINAFAYYGGKNSHLNFILPYINYSLTNFQTNTFIDTYGGSGAIILNTHAPVMIYNDLNGIVVNFFKVLREHQDDFIRQCTLTPYAREEYNVAVDKLKGKNSLEEKDDQIECARLFFILARMTMNGICTTPTKGNWKTSVNHSRRGIASVVSAYLSSLDGLPDVAEKLMQIQIENKPALDLIKKYDSPNVCWYEDPPYPLNTRTGGKAYSLEMTEKDHEKYLNECINRQGKLIISSYENDLYSNKLLPNGFFLYKDKAKNAPATVRDHGDTVNNMRTEALYCNFEVKNDL